MVKWDNRNVPKDPFIIIGKLASGFLVLAVGEHFQMTTVTTAQKKWMLLAVGPILITPPRLLMI